MTDLIRKRSLLVATLSLLAIGIVGAVYCAHKLWPFPPESLGAIGRIPAGLRVGEIIEPHVSSPGLMEPPFEKSGSSGKGRVHYFADGFSLSDPDSPNRQATWVCMFNPSKRPAKLQFTFYYEDCNPTRMQYEVPAETSKVIALYDRKEVLRNRRFGAKIESSEPMVVQVTTGYFGRGDKADWYTRAMHSVICNDTLSRINYYADGLVLDRKGVRLKEPEWAFLLNPNPEVAKVFLRTCNADGLKRAYALDIPPQRLFPLRLDDLVAKNVLFGAKFVSSVPIAVQQTRWIEEEDRKTIRSAFSVMAKPGELSRPEGE